MSDPSPPNAVPSDRRGATATPTSKAAAQHRWRSVDLFGPHGEVLIEHGSTLYRLRRTALGKLILTK